MRAKYIRVASVICFEGAGSWEKYCFKVIHRPKLAQVAHWHFKILRRPGTLNQSLAIKICTDLVILLHIKIMYMYINS